MLSSKTLKPSSMESLSGLSSLPRRRSHLDSASYRTLSRIFSVCRELSHKPQVPEPHVTISSVADEDKPNAPAKSGNPKLCHKIKSLQLVVEKIDSVEHQNPNPPDATISSVAVENCVSDSAKFESPKLDMAVEALQSVSEPGNPNLDATLCSVSDKDQTSDHGILENSKLDETVEALQLASKISDSLEFQKPNPIAILNSGTNEDLTSDPGKIENRLDETVEALQLVVENIDSMDGVEIDVSSYNERLNLMVSDLSLLVGGPNDQMQSGLGEFAPDGQMKDEKDQKLSLEGELNYKKDQNQQTEVGNISIEKIETGNNAVLDSNCQAIASANEIDQLGVDEMLKRDLSNETMEVGVVESIDFSLDIGEEIQLESANEISILKISNQDKLNDSIEEGEITDEAQDWEDESDFDDKVEPIIDDELEDGLVDTRSSEKLATKEDRPGLEHEKVVRQNHGIDPSEEADVVGDKRKRVRAGRKERKKKAYRIKRARKLREDGVKRLRLPPPVKKEIEKKICKFYVQGKCQQGSQCKFSHDVTPVTKSKACTHFARGECLKGDECPYDHNLSKYPCHMFVSEGMCIRGDNCKFSHNIQNTEDVSVQTKEHGGELSDKSHMGKHTNKSQKYSTAKCTAGDPVKNLKPGLNKSTEAPVRVPKGMQFLSIGSETKQEKHSDAEPATKQKPCRMEQNLLNVKKESEKISSQAARVSASGESFETPKNFEEFMFGGISASI